MVALLVSLRWRQLGHQLTKNPWMIVSLVVFGLMALGALFGLGAGLIAMRVTAPELAAMVLVLLGAVVTLGWWAGAVLVSADELLAPERFSLLPVRASQLLPGLLAASALGIGGMFTLVFLLLSLIGWSASWPAVIAAVVMLPVAFAICILGARVVAGLLASWLAGRKTRDLVAVLVALVLIFSGVILNLGVSAFASLEDPRAAVTDLAAVAAWTPLGAAFGVPAAISQGAVGVATARLVIALVTLAALWLAARAMLAARLVAPIVNRGGGRIRGGALLDRMLPASPAGAIAARALRYRRRDPRHILNTVALVALPILFVVPIVLQPEEFDLGVLRNMIVLAPSISALMVATIVQMDVAYDNNAVALHVLVGLRGSSDRAGRVLGVLVIAVPSAVVLSIAACGFTGAWELLPAALGSSIGLSAIAAGAGALVGTWLPGRAPAPEASPLGRGSSGGIQSLLALLIMMPAAGIVGGLPFGLAIAALWNPWLGWLSLLSGLVLGGLAVWGGVVWGGRVLDRRWPEILAEVGSES
ncbi:hypothetical protein [Microbacterium stercoris]|uniref:ABC-2 type transport system permease protein n=1 Tax=Microbacterium stercoris TaxID=2820289 RepID=A0A939TVS1_9MICO|nr:hypothetical protein [Microbacterium stercoris]MBO3661892.1 hypothetical protein [Microbacterium stercoris]